jgi:hypothetical protein
MWFRLLKMWFRLLSNFFLIILNLRICNRPCKPTSIRFEMPSLTEINELSSGGGSGGGGGNTGNSENDRNCGNCGKDGNADSGECGEGDGVGEGCNSSSSGSKPLHQPMLPVAAVGPSGSIKQALPLLPTIRIDTAANTNSLSCTDRTRLSQKEQKLVNDKLRSRSGSSLSASASASTNVSALIAAAATAVANESNERNERVQSKPTNVLTSLEYLINNSSKNSLFNTTAAIANMAAAAAAANEAMDNGVNATASDETNEAVIQSLLIDLVSPAAAAAAAAAAVGAISTQANANTNVNNPIVNASSQFDLSSTASTENNEFSLIYPSHALNELSNNFSSLNLLTGSKQGQDFNSYIINGGAEM